MKQRGFYILLFYIFLTSINNPLFAQATEYISSGGTNPQGRIYYAIVDDHAEIRTPGLPASMYNNWTAPSWSNYTQYKPSGIVHIPDSIDHYGTKYSVTVVGFRAFDQCNGITHINIPDAVTSIGFRAFCDCQALDSITIPDNVTEVGEEAFSGDTSLHFIDIGNSVTTIGNRAFASTGVDSIHIPTNVNSIGVRAFQGCKRLTQIFIPENVTCIGYGLSSYCDSLTSISVSNSNPVYDSRGNCNAIIETLSNKLIAGCKNTTIDNSISVIDTCAFEYCKGLETISIGTGVKVINYSAFYGCDNLHSVAIPDSVTIIGSFAFGSCDGLSLVSIGRGVTTIHRNAFSFCSNLQTVEYNADSCGFAGDSVYSYQLSSRNIFHSCPNLSHITIGDSVRYIPDFLFYFYYDERPFGVTKIIIPRYVSYIGRNAFHELPNLDTIVMMPEIPPVLGPTPWIVPTIIIPRCSYGSYITAPTWSYYYSRLHEPEIEIAINVNTSDAERGNANIIRLYNRDVRCDSTAIIEAIANDGFHFGYWSNGSTNTPDTIHLVHDSLITAYFFQINAYSNDLNSGTVEHSKISERMEKIVAMPQYGYHFSHWSNGSIANPDTIQLISDSLIIAYFEKNEYILSATLNDENMGTITFPRGTSVPYLDTLWAVAQAYEHYHFDNWSGDITSTQDTVWIKMTRNFSIHCTFTIDVHSISVTPNYYDRGTVTGGGAYDYGSPCVLTAIPYTGYVFSQWSNGITSNPYAFPVEEDIELTAIFLTEGEVGIGDIATDNINIYSHNNHIMVEGTTDEVHVFDMIGRSVRNEALPAGVYMVKVGNYPARKVVVIR